MKQSYKLTDTEVLLKSYKALAELVVANAEKLVSLQTKHFMEHSDVACSNVKDAASISDLEQSIAFFQKQTEIAKHVAETGRQDATELSKLSQAYADDIVELSNAYIADIQSVFFANAEEVIERVTSVNPHSVIDISMAKPKRK